MMSIVIYTGYKPWHSPTNLRSFLVYISRVLDQEEQSPGPDLQDFSEIKNMLEHRKNGWKEEAYSEGINQGIHNGLAIMLVEQMTEKFGAISEAQTKQIQEMNDEALRQLGRRLLSVNTLEELLG